MSVHSVLIVDDDVGFGRLVKRALSGMGHIVEQISNPREIMDRYDTFAPSIIFLDIFMPDFDGMAVAKWLAEKNYDGTIVFMTGHDPVFLTMARQVVGGNTEAHVATLEKPVRVSQIRELLNGPPKSPPAEEPAASESDDKRGSSRMKTLKSGTIVYQNDSCTMNCMILDLSDRGAKLRPIDVTILPETFRLMIAHSSTYSCEVVRRTRDQVAVRFV